MLVEMQSFRVTENGVATYGVACTLLALVAFVKFPGIGGGTARSVLETRLADSRVNPKRITIFKQYVIYNKTQL